MVEVSQSRVKTWLACRQKHYFKYVEKLEPKIKARPLQFGTIVHEMLDSFANGDDPFEKLKQIEHSQGKMFRSQREELGELVWSIETIMEEYFKYYENNPMKFSRLKGRKSEHELKVEIAPDIVLVMKLDCIVITPNKMRWLLENKTFTRLPTDEDRWRNLQIAVYVKGCEMIGIKPFDGVCWNYIRSKQPSVPGINMDGSMSRRPCDTLPSIVIDTADKYGVKKYKDHLRKAKERLGTWFQRIFTPISPQVVDLIFKDFVVASEEIKKDGKILRHKTIDKHCTWCAYQPICETELTGGDPNFVKERQYEKRKKRKKASRKNNR